MQTNAHRIVSFDITTIMYALKQTRHLPAALRLLTLPVSILSIIAFVHSLAWDSWDNVGVLWERGNRFLGQSAYVSVCLKPLHPFFSNEPVHLYGRCAEKILKETT